MKTEGNFSGLLYAVSDDAELRRETNRLNDSKAGSDIFMNWRRIMWNFTFAGETVAEANYLIAKYGIEKLYADSYDATKAW